MGHTAPGGFTVHCPKCGQEVECKVRLAYVGVYSSDYLHVVYVNEQNVQHKCPPRPDTDGLRPIERFIKHGALDDMGAQHQHGGRP